MGRGGVVAVEGEGGFGGVPRAREFSVVVTNDFHGEHDVFLLPRRRHHQLITLSRHY